MNPNPGSEALRIPSRRGVVHKEVTERVLEEEGAERVFEEEGTKQVFEEEGIKRESSEGP